MTLANLAYFLFLISALIYFLSEPVSNCGAGWGAAPLGPLGPLGLKHELQQPLIVSLTNGKL